MDYRAALENAYSKPPSQEGDRQLFVAVEALAYMLPSGWHKKRLLFGYNQLMRSQLSHGKLVYLLRREFGDRLEHHGHTLTIDGWPIGGIEDFRDSLRRRGWEISGMEAVEALTIAAAQGGY